MPKKKGPKGISPSDERQAQIKDIVNKSELLFGQGSIGTLRGINALLAPTSTGIIDTGSLGLNDALGVGGYPRGRVVEIFGMEASGKTTLALHAVAQTQMAGHLAAFVDAEQAFDDTYAESIGVNLSELLFSQPKSGEQALQQVATLVESGVGIVIVDSVAALVPQAELDGEIGQSHVGLQARLMSQALRMLTASVRKSNCVVIFINQIRMKIGVRFGSPKTTPGGNALKFYASVRLEVSRIGSLTKGDDAYGNRVRVKVVKNKVAAPYKQCEFDINFGKGISWEGELLDVAIGASVVRKSGAWYKYGDENIGHGRHNALSYLRDNPDIAQEIRVAARGEQNGKDE